MLATSTPFLLIMAAVALCASACFAFGVFLFVRAVIRDRRENREMGAWANRLPRL